MAGSTFEMQLAQLADAEISQNAPSLVPYKVGFQLIDKDNDETRGVGVSVYLVEGKQWIYVPAFFLNGRLRGTEYMYIPAMNAWRPTQEKWISQVKSKLPHSLGKPADKDSKGREKAVAPGNVNMGSRMSPFSKHSSLIRPDEWAAMCEYCPTELKDMFDLNKWIPVLGKKAAASFAVELNRNADFANALLRFYKPEDLHTMVKTALEENVPDGDTELQVITPDMPDAEKLAEKEKEVLMRDGIFVVDGRKETSAVFRQDNSHRSLASPTEDGPHDVLMSDGSFCRFHVLFVNSRLSNLRRIYTGGSSRSILLIPYDNTKIAIYAPEAVQAWKAEKGEKEDPQLGMAMSSLRDQPDMGRMVVFKDDRAFIVDYSRGPRTVVGNRIFVSLGGAHGNYCVEFTGLPGKLYVANGTLYVPEGCRMCRVIQDWDREAKHYSFGDPNTVMRQITGPGGLKPLKVYSDGCSVTLTASELLKDPMKIETLDKRAAVLRLIKRHGIEAGVAKAMVKEAASGPRPKAVRFLIKYAQDISTDETDLGKSAPDTFEEDVVGGVPQDDVAKAITASNNGTKDVMDVSILRSLAKKTRPMDAVDDMVPDLMNAMNQVGRTLFLFYWHNDAFAERFGRDSMEELEGSLRDLFDQLADVSLFFAAKRVKADAAIEDMSGDLVDDIGA